MIRQFADSFLHKYGDRLAILAAFLVPVKLSLSLILIVPLTAATLASSRLLELKDNKLVHSLLMFFAFTALAGCFGIRPLKSLKEISGLMFYSAAFIPFYYAAKQRWRDIVLALLCGQGLAGLHSVADSALSWGMPKFFPGRVTESGQVALSLFGMAALFASAKVVPPFPHKLLAATLFAVLLICGFSGHFLSPSWMVVPLLSIGLVAAWLIFLLLKYWMGRSCERSALLLTVAPILLSALILNLKRGPWVGVFLAACFLLWHYRRRLILPIFLAVVGVTVGVAPIRDRLLESSENFFVKGGRNTIWETALDVSVRFPLGVGVGNAGVLRDFAPDVPEGLSHFHSNPLNILAETGWVGLAIFVAFIVKCVAYGMRQPRRAPGLIAVAVIACWQIAGLVEYNIGDTEVLLALVVMLGALAAQADIKCADNQIC